MELKGYLATHQGDWREPVIWSEFARELGNNGKPGSDRRAIMIAPVKRHSLTNGDTDYECLAMYLDVPTGPIFISTMDDTGFWFPWNSDDFKEWVNDPAEQGWILAAVPEFVEWAN